MRSAGLFPARCDHLVSALSVPDRSGHASRKAQALSGVGADGRPAKQGVFPYVLTLFISGTGYTMTLPLPPSWSVQCAGNAPRRA
jgi:hypothetical protein